MFLYKKLSKCRLEKNLNQTDLMFALDKIGWRICRPTLSHWETGETAPNANELAMLADFYGKPIQYFFDQPKCEGI